MAMPHSRRLLPGHTDESTIGREWEENPFIRVWRGAEPEGTEPVTVHGRPATLIVWSPDYDGKGKAWVRFDNGEDAIGRLGGSPVASWPWLTRSCACRSSTAQRCDVAKGVAAKLEFDLVDEEIVLQAAAGSTRAWSPTPSAAAPSSSARSPASVPAATLTRSRSQAPGTPGWASARTSACSQAIEETADRGKRDRGACRLPRPRGSRRSRARHSLPERGARVAARAGSTRRRPRRASSARAARADTSASTTRREPDPVRPRGQYRPDPRRAVELVARRRERAGLSEKDSTLPCA